MGGEAEHAPRAVGAALAGRLSVPSNLSSARDVTLHVLAVALAYALLLHTGFHWSACVLAFLVVAKAQNSLMLSGHEAIHHALFGGRRWNDGVGRYVCFAPMGIGLHRARAAHLDHHAHLSTERDEKIDFQLVNRTRLAFLRHLLCPLVGSYAWKGLSRLAGYTGARRARPTYTLTTAQRRTDLVSIAVASGALIGLLGILDWRLYPGFWIGPLLTTTAFFHHAKAFLDHAHAPGEPDGTLYSYRVTWIDRLFFGVQQARHAEHHLWPRVPYVRLPELAAVVARRPDVRYRGGYFAELLRYYRGLHP